MISDKERESESLRESEREKEREVSKMKYFEGASEQGGLKVEAEAMTTDERATTMSKRRDRSPMWRCALD